MSLREIMFFDKSKTMKTSHPAVVLFEKTLAEAKDGDAVAMFNLGVKYEIGEGVLEDDEEAVKWFRKAAELGHAEAMFFLGIVYFRGKGVIEDDKEAVKWYRKAADVGYAKAMVHLGLMYATGEGVIEDDVEAYGWFNVAAANGYKRTAELREMIKNDMTSEQIAEGQKRSREIMEFLTKK